MIDIDSHFPLFDACKKDGLRISEPRLVAGIDADIALRVQRGRAADILHPLEEKELFGDLALVDDFIGDIQQKKSAGQRHCAPEGVPVGAHVRKDHRAFQMTYDVCNF